MTDTCATQAFHRARIGGRRRARKGIVSMTSRAAARGLLVWLLVAASVSGCRAADERGLGTPRTIAPGVRYYTLSDPALLDPPGPVAVQILRLDPARVRLKSALAQDQIMGTETVQSMAVRHGAIAAVNAGFFAPNGDPTGVLQVDRELVSDRARGRGAVAIAQDARGRTTLLFDVVSATAAIRVKSGEEAAPFPVAGIDTTRQRGRLMLFTPRYHEHTDTATHGIEWVVDGSPPIVQAVRVDAGSTPIPRTGFVLSFGGLAPPPPLDGLDVGDEVSLERQFSTSHGTQPDLWASAEHVIGGAGLIVRDGKPLTGWGNEDLKPGFTEVRHPRTLIGVDRAGDIWLVTIDGRNPQISLGMTFAELTRLAQRLRLSDALNLDGGGSTTMVVHGEVMNHPSDSAGPRKVSDALLILER